MRRSAAGFVALATALLVGCAASGGQNPAGADRAPAVQAAPAVASAQPPTAGAEHAPPTERTSIPALAAPSAPAMSVPPIPAADAPPESACAAVTHAGPAREIALAAVGDILRGGDYRRGPFEDAEDFRHRLGARIAAVQNLAVATTGRAELVFSIKIPDYRLVYEAAARQLIVGSDLGLLRSSSAIGMGDFLLVASAERETGIHVANTSYLPKPKLDRDKPDSAKEKQEVIRVAGNQLGVIVPGGAASGWPAKFAKLSLAMTPAEAALAKPNLSVLFVGRLQDPFFATGEFLQEPKRDEPVEKRLTVEAIRIQPDCAAIYNRATGQLLRELDLGRG